MSGRLLQAKTAGSIATVNLCSTNHTGRYQSADLRAKGLSSSSSTYSLGLESAALQAPVALVGEFAAGTVEHSLGLVDLTEAHLMEFAHTDTET